MIPLSLKLPEKKEIEHQMGISVHGRFSLSKWAQK
jgi:hypothetical protein